MISCRNHDTNVEAASHRTRRPYRACASARQQAGRATAQRRLTRFVLAAFLAFITFLTICQHRHVVRNSSADKTVNILSHTCNFLSFFSHSFEKNALAYFRPDRKSSATHSRYARSCVAPSARYSTQRSLILTAGTPHPTRPT